MVVVGAQILDGEEVGDDGDDAKGVVEAVEGSHNTGDASDEEVVEICLVVDSLHEIEFPYHGVAVVVVVVIVH